MMGGNATFESLEGKTPALFLLAGGLLVVFAVNTGLETFAGTFYPPVQNIVGPTGFFLGVVGLLGLYPALADRTRTVARVVGVVAAVSAVGWFVIVVGGLGELAGILPNSEEILPGVFFVGVFLFTMLAYTGVALTSLRTGAHSRTLGFLLVGPAAMFLLLFLGAAPNFVIDTGHVLVHLGIGIVLRAEGIPTDRARPAPDSTA